MMLLAFETASPSLFVPLSAVNSGPFSFPPTLHILCRPEALSSRLSRLQWKWSSGRKKKKKVVEGRRGHCGWKCTHRIGDDDDGMLLCPLPNGRDSLGTHLSLSASLMMMMMMIPPPVCYTHYETILWASYFFRAVAISVLLLQSPNDTESPFQKLFFPSFASSKESPLIFSLLLMRKMVYNEEGSFTTMEEEKRREREAARLSHSKTLKKGS